MTAYECGPSHGLNAYFEQSAKGEMGKALREIDGVMQVGDTNYVAYHLSGEATNAFTCVTGTTMQ